MKSAHQLVKGFGARRILDQKESAQHDQDDADHPIASAIMAFSACFAAVNGLVAYRLFVHGFLLLLLISYLLLICQHIAHG